MEKGRDLPEIKEVENNCNPQLAFYAQLGPMIIEKHAKVRTNALNSTSVHEDFSAKRILSFQNNYWLVGKIASGEEWIGFTSEEERRKNNRTLLIFVHNNNNNNKKIVLPKSEVLESWKLEKIPHSKITTVTDLTIFINKYLKGCIQESRPRGGGLKDQNNDNNNNDNKQNYQATIQVFNITQLFTLEETKKQFSYLGIIVDVVGVVVEVDVSD